jgi:hypothetical protein
LRHSPGTGEYGVGVCKGVLKLSNAKAMRWSTRYDGKRGAGIFGKFLMPED